MASSSSPFAERFWKKAIESLTEEVKRDIDFTQTNKLSILGDILTAVEKGKYAYLEKRWKYRKGGQNIIIRDRLDKIVHWIDKFKAVVTVNDSQIYGAMIDGIEYVTNLIARFAVIEALNDDSQKDVRPATSTQFESSVVRLYAAILEYLRVARRYYDHSTTKRMALAIIDTTESTVNLALAKIRTALVDSDARLQLIDAEVRNKQRYELQKIQQDLKALQIDSQEITPTTTKLLSIITTLEEPVFRQASQIVDLHDSLESGWSQRQDLLRWLSCINYRSHHKTISEGFLPNSGEWLLHREEFLDWRTSSVSSILWLRGSPGSGKTRLVYSVVERLLKEALGVTSPAPLAYFYYLPIRGPVAAKYKEMAQDAEYFGFQLERLSLAECETLIIALLEDNPATIVIDTLDECRSLNLVKIFIASREDDDIVCHLEEVPNIIINATDNSSDIERFIKVEIGKAIVFKTLLGGRASDNLQEKIRSTLVEKAQGMFQWVSLQMDNLCDSDRIKHKKDVELELGRLPKTLEDSYRTIHQRIKNSGFASRTLADRAIAWLLCARAQLPAPAFLDAISVDDNGQTYELSVRDLLNMCCNLLVLDPETNCFRFSHLSVRGYFEVQPDYNWGSINKMAAARCVNVFINLASLNHGLKSNTTYESSVEMDFKSYAAKNWSNHCYCTGSLICNDRVEKFLFSGLKLGPGFQCWLSDNCYYQVFEDIGRNDMYFETQGGPNSAAVQKALYLACACGFSELLARFRKFSDIDWNQPNQSQRRALQIWFAGMTTGGFKALTASFRGDLPLSMEEEGAGLELLLSKTENVAYLGTSKFKIMQWALGWFPRIIKLLLAKHFGINTSDEIGATALHLAAFMGNVDDMKMFLESEAIDLDIVDYQGWTPVKIAASRGTPEVVQILIERGANVNINNEARNSPSQDDMKSGEGHILKIVIACDFFSLESEGVISRVRAAPFDENRESVRSKSNQMRSEMREANEKIMKLLIDAGANVNFHVNGQNTALYEASGTGNVEMVQILLDAGANANCEMNSEGAALRRAAEDGDFEVFSLLLSSGGALDSGDRLCYTALQIAAKNGFREVVKALLAAGANAKTVNNFGWTAGDLAATWGHIEVAKLLMPVENIDFKTDNVCPTRFYCEEVYSKCGSPVEEFFPLKDETSIPKLHLNDDETTEKVDEI
ncbi:hypothetical protein B0J14DRAFT_659379 [Halenospora varia]|nr:hypothetical protein B0J14DRAFT_659379 [Halenospora varia]